MSEIDLYEKIKSGPFFLLGPCVIERWELLETIASQLLKLKDKYQVPIVFKASFDKANRTSGTAYRGFPIREGMAMLQKVKETFGFPIITDIHESYQAEIAAEVADVLQIPAFLCRQTDLLVAAGKTGKIVNIKKAQFLSGAEMKYPADKVAATGNSKILLTERGTMFGYNNLVVDFRNLIDMANIGYPVVMDCTHSVQRPGAGDGKTIGNREFVPYMALSAKVWGASGYFLEVHPDPDNAPSDGPNMLFLNHLDGLMEKILHS